MSTLAGITIPDDLEWVDEFTWSPMAQQIEVATAGSLIIEESKQLAGRWISLRSWNEGSNYAAVVDHSTVLALKALAEVPRGQGDAMVLSIPESVNAGVYTYRTFNVLFRHTELGFEARPWKHVTPARSDGADTAKYLINLRLIAV